MKKQALIFGMCFLIGVCFLICITAQKALASLSAWNFDIDLSYEKTDETQVGKPRLTTHDFRQEYQIRHSNSLSKETKMEGELKARFERECNHGSSDRPDTTLNEPYAKFQLRSRLYDFGAGYKESEQKTSFKLLQNEGFVDFKLQPESLPELNIKYDFSGEAKSGDPETYLHHISLSSIYSLRDFFKLRFGYEGEVTDYRTNKRTGARGHDIKEGNLFGQLTLKHFLLANKLRFDLDYKVEKEGEKNEQDPNTNSSSKWTWANDRIIQTAITKLTYKLTSATTLSAYYENEHTDNKQTEEGKRNQGEQADIFRMDISQVVSSFIRVFGKYRSEENKDERESEVINSYDAEIQADPQKWLNLSGKVKIESRDVDHFTDNSQDRKEDTQTAEGSWRADLPQLLKARNTFDLKLVREKEQGQDSFQEEQYRWRLQLTPLANLDLTPEYTISHEENFREGNPLLPRDKITREFKTVIAYGLLLSPRLKADLSHSLSRKWITEKPGSQQNEENNDDSKLDLRFTPTQNLTLSTQIMRQDKRTIDNGYLTRDEVDTSYAFNYDWRFDPFTWSSSFKYDDRKHKPESEGDTETAESKLTYKFRNYDFTTNYKYTKTYSLDNDKEHRIELQVRAYY